MWWNLPPIILTPNLTLLYNIIILYSIVYTVYSTLLENILETCFLVGLVGLCDFSNKITSHSITDHMARLVIPARVKVRGKWWPVTRNMDLDNTVYDGHPGVLTKVLGAVVSKNIFLSHRVQGKREEKVTLIHELIHACSSPGILTPAKEEKFCEDIDHHLLNALESLEWLP